MMCYQMKSETEQFNLRADKTVLDKLQNLADRFNKRSKAQVAVEIIEQYMDFWEQAEATKANTIERQRNALRSSTEIEPNRKIKGVPIGSLDLTKKVESKKKAG